MTERLQNSVAETRIESRSENFNLSSTMKGGGFRADREAVSGFGRRDSRVPFNYDGVREFNIRRMEENATKLEKDLIIKELETLDFLEALGSTRKIVQDLKLELQKQPLRCIESPQHLGSQIKEVIHERCHKKTIKSPDMSFMQASMNLGKAIDDHAMIQLRIEEEEGFFGAASLAEELNSLRSTPADPDQGKRYKTDNFVENPQCEQVKMVTETNGTAFHKQNKTCLKTAEMRLVAARKMEEAARATEALAIAEMTILYSGKKQDGFCFLEEPTHMKKDTSANISKTKLLMKLEEANEEVKQSKQALEMALNQVEIASMKQLEAGDAFRQWNIESWKDQKAIKAKPFLSHVNQHEPLVDLRKPVMKRNVSMGSVLNSRKQVATSDDKQLVTPRRKFRFIHSTVPEHNL